MKRSLLVLAAGLSMSVAAGAMAQAATVTVTVGPELQKQSESYGKDEVARLADDLRQTVEKRLARSGDTSPQRVDLVLEAAKPNRPTFAQMGRVTGLSMQSIGLGGAAITGSVTAIDGSSRPISYKWYETDLRQVIGYTTWTDADRTFDRLASLLASGKAPNAGPYRPDMTSKAAFQIWR